MTSSAAIRRRLLVDGIVQGVGFRPFVYNLAVSEQLAGFVTNTSDGVVIEIQGPAEVLDRFAVRLIGEVPPLADILSVAVASVATESGASDFIIRPSVNAPGTRTLIPPDVATCSDCLAEIRDPADRRYGYSFTNCTNCGPRWTIINRIPYDRPHTSMAPFTMCPACQAEYDDPGNRRFHAQPNACPECGPRVWLEDLDGVVPGRTDPLEAAAGLLAVGRILAIKGLGGFHLAVRADDEKAVQRLRRRKNREAKPLAVMAGDLEIADHLGMIGDPERKLLSSPRAPIVLVPKNDGGQRAAPSVAAGHHRLGVMLPYTPLHHLLFDKLRARGVEALVMTSGNAGDEPICLDNREAVERLRDIADSWLLHDRDIVRRADDSVIQDLDGAPLLFRRSRGHAPVPISLNGVNPGPDILAVGPELKNTVCLLKENRAFLSPHIGDLQNLQAHGFFTETVATLQDVLECAPKIIAHDLHPGYFSTRWAKEHSGDGVELVSVQHHHAHMAAVMAEHGLADPVIGLIMDGTGYGTDGTIWGGEILAGDLKEFRRVGHLDPVPLPGGDAAIRAPWRTAVSYLRHAYGRDLPVLPWFDELPVAQVMEMLEKGVNSPVTSSCGRLFDAVAALTGGWTEARYEAQAAIEMMALTSVAEVSAAMPFAVDAPRGAVLPDLVSAEDVGSFIVPVDFIIRGTIQAIAGGAPCAEISARFHRTLSDLLAAAAQEASRRTGLREVVLAGGVFQNEILLQETARLLRADGFTVHRPQQVPANDGAVALGQAAVARVLTAAAE